MKNAQGKGQVQNFNSMLSVQRKPIMLNQLVDQHFAS